MPVFSGLERWLPPDRRRSPPGKAPASRTETRSEAWRGDAGVGRMVVDRLEVLGLGEIVDHGGVVAQTASHIAHQVLDELRVVVGTLGDELLIDPLEQAIDLAGGLLLGDADQRLGRDRLAGAHRSRRWSWSRGTGS